MNVMAVRRSLSHAFRAGGLDTPELDARVLVGHALSLDHAALAAAAERLLSRQEEAEIDALARRRLSGEPVARIVGWKEFWDLPIRLGPAVLVPRPETETVVETALSLVDAQGWRFAALRIADLGTGSGALIAALLSELPRAFAVGTDVSQAALAIARDNCRRLGFGARARFVACQFGASLNGGFDLVVSNPPYVKTDDIAALAIEVRDHDPVVALDGGPDGLAAYAALAGDAERLLSRRGYLVVELGAGAAADVSALFSAAGLKPLAPRLDLAGVARTLPITRAACR
jgi:release factor glutamine methyltransferase